MPEIRILCTECLQDLEAEYCSVLPQTSGDGYLVTPCCGTEGTAETIAYVGDELLYDMNDASDKLQDAIDDIQSMFPELLSDYEFEECLNKIKYHKKELDTVHAELSKEWERK